MRCVLINELFSFGGTEMQSLREKHLMEHKGHKVLYITFDSTLPHGWDTEEPHHFNFSVGYTKNQRRLYSYVRDRELSARVKRLIDRFRPDFIHVNNSYGYSYVVSYVCRNYPSVRTVRDYGAVCPNNFCIDKDKQICGGVCKAFCLKKCMPEKHKRQFLSNYLKFRKRRHEERKAVNFFLCPSRTLTEYCCRNGIKTACLNNSFDFSAIPTRSTADKRVRVKKFLYYGLVAAHKGVFELLEAFKAFSKDRDVILDIAGRLDESSRERFERCIAGSEKIIYHGALAYPDMMQLLTSADCVVVPSLWMENYPNTVLEGLSAGCIVLASNRGGMKEMIRDNRMIFDVLDQQDIISKLEFAYSLPADEIVQITQSNYHRVKYNNSLEKYYQRFMKLVSVLTKDE